MLVPVSEPWCLIQWNERSVMVAGVVSSAAALFDDDPFRAPRAATYFRIHVVLAIVAKGQPSFPILKRSAADKSREGFALMLLNCFQQVFDFL